MLLLKVILQTDERFSVQGCIFIIVYLLFYIKIDLNISYQKNHSKQNQWENNSNQRILINYASFLDGSQFADGVKLQRWFFHPKCPEFLCFKTWYLNKIDQKSLGFSLDVPIPTGPVRTLTGLRRLRNLVAGLVGPPTAQSHKDEPCQSQEAEDSLKVVMPKGNSNIWKWNSNGYVVWLLYKVYYAI